MLTLFTIPKAFVGHIGDIQRNAIKSWTLLRPKCEVILLADDSGTSEVAEELGVKHLPQVNRNEFGTPLLDSAYRLAEQEASYQHLCYINADIVLTSSFVDAATTVMKNSDWFLMTARRWNLDVSGRMDFGRLGRHTEIDFWLYSKGLLSEIPPLAVGRMAFECWCLYKARAMNADLIDATDVVMSLHQNHDYSHHPDGEEGIGTSTEAQRNRALVGGKPYFFVVEDRTHVLTDTGLKRARDIWWLWRSLRPSQVLPVAIPMPARLLVNTLNEVINLTRDLLVAVKRLALRVESIINQA